MSRGFDHLAVVVESVEGNLALVLDSFGVKRTLRIDHRRGGGPRPRTGERWTITRSMGHWSFDSLQVAKPPVISSSLAQVPALRDLLIALNEGGIIDNQAVEGPGTDHPDADHADVFSPLGHDHAFASRTAMRIAGHNLSGGGVVTWDGGSIKWTQRFIVISAGRGAHFSASGYYDIQPPGVGVVIPGYGGAANFTVATTGVVAITAWHALYAVLPPNGMYNSPTLALVTYGSAFTVPDNWVLLAVRNGDDGRLRLGTGETLDYWRDLPFVNGYVNYNATSHRPGYKKLTDGMVIFRGLITGGTAQQFASALPVGYRPSTHQYWEAQGNDNAYVSRRMHMNKDGANLHILQPLPTATTSWTSLDNIHFFAEA